MVETMIFSIYIVLGMIYVKLCDINKKLKNKE